MARELKLTTVVTLKLSILLIEVSGIVVQRIRRVCRVD